MFLWRTPHRWYFLLALLVGGGAGWLGWKNEVRAISGAGAPPLKFRSATRHLLMDRSQKDAFARLNELRHRASWMDLTTAEKRECWEIFRSFSEQQLTAYLEELPLDNGKAANWTLACMVFHRWAQLAPEAAARASMTPPYSKHRELAFPIIGAWFFNDQESAAKWVNLNGSQDMKIAYERIAGKAIFYQDPEGGLEKAEAIGPEALRAALIVLASKSAATRESRSDYLKLLAESGDPMHWFSGTYSLVLAAPEEEVEGLLDDVVDSGIPEDLAKEYRNRLIDRLIRIDHERAMDWAMSGRSGVSDEKRLTMFETWAGIERWDEAAEWALKSGRTDFISASVSRQANAMLRNGWQMGHQPDFGADLPARYQTWQAQEPEAAGAWLGSMPSDMRKFIKEGSADGHTR